MSLRLGIDAGSTATKAVLLDAGGTVLARAVTESGHDSAAAADRLRTELLQGREGRSCLCVATGYGRSRVSFADKTQTEITCHARGVRHLHAEARTVIDIGGQDSKAMRLGSDGGVEDFAMNDRCAAGTGSFLDAITRRFGSSFRGWEALPVAVRPVEISATCAVFAESEIVGLLARGTPPEEVLAGVLAAVARRVAALAAQVKPVAPVVFTGGVAMIDPLRRALEVELGLPVIRATDPQFTGAIGAALAGAGTPAGRATPSS